MRYAPNLSTCSKHKKKGAAMQKTNTRTRREFLGCMEGPDSYVSSGSAGLHRPPREFLYLSFLDLATFPYNW